MASSTEDVKEKKTAAGILIDRFLQDVDETGLMPWQRPYQCYNAFNWVTKQPYHGINRIILPFGEYLTANQIRDYNKSHKEDFKYQKGIKWYPIAYFTRQNKSVAKSEISKVAENMGIDLDTVEAGYLFTSGAYNFYKTDTGSFEKCRNVLRYYEVTDRKHLRNSKGEELPSRIEQGEVEITLSNPKEVIDNYINSSGVTVDYEYGGTPNYSPMLDKVSLNPYTVSQEEWFSTAFHEFAHSTGARKRLNREGFNLSGLSDTDRKDRKAAEECIAEITASLCCAECGVNTFNTSECKSYANNIAYVQAWKSRIRKWDKQFIYIVSQAEKAFQYIMGDEI